MGPSPRIRGEFRRPSSLIPHFGTIPANTGRILHRVSQHTGPWDHPREYGENDTLKLTLEAWTGPSPRIRGESTDKDGNVLIWGTIPANTGRIYRPTHRNHPRRDHPREYGENTKSGGKDAPPEGPSPRIRGEWATFILWMVSGRTIPANTGRILSGRFGMSLYRDHPREYGENEYFTQLFHVFSGPSPRIRGECALRIPHHAWTGTIPANTGRIPHAPHHGQCPWDHPREYGENEVQQAFREASAGPSPRIRGEFGGCVAGHFRGGTIPANTGRIVTAAGYQRRRRDHPREYGENISSRPGDSGNSGPSPRIRGEYTCVTLVNSSPGTIPANTGRIATGITGLGQVGDHPREYGENTC